MENTSEDKKKFDKRAYMKKYRLENADRIRISNKKYKEENKEYIKSWVKQYQEKNSEIIHKRQKEYHEKHKDSRNKQSKNYYHKNKAILKTRREENIESFRKYQREYVKNKRNDDPVFKMVCDLRIRIRMALKSQGTTKDISSKELFGADQEFVWKHLESQFREGMTRENNTSKGWHIDHIRPMSSFDLSDPAQLKECCHYTNLQPLWWWENLKKSDKLIR